MTNVRQKKPKGQTFVSILQSCPLINILSIWDISSIRKSCLLSSQELLLTKSWNNSTYFYYFKNDFKVCILNKKNKNFKFLHVGVDVEF